MVQAVQVCGLVPYAHRPGPDTLSVLGCGGLIAHAVVKRVYVELRERADYLQRLAFYTITEDEAAQFEWVHLTGSKPEDIDVVVSLDEDDLEAMRRALDCYVTYAATIEAHRDGTGIKRNIPREAVFEIYQETHDPPLAELLDGVEYA